MINEACRRIQRIDGTVIDDNMSTEEIQEILLYITLTPTRTSTTTPTPHIVIVVATT